MGGGGAQGALGSLSKAKVYVLMTNQNYICDVAGVDEAKDELTEIVDFQKPERYTEIGARIPKVLLVGPPGTGKTLLSKAVAGEAEVLFYNFRFGYCFCGCRARVRDLFEQAKKKAPCIILLMNLTPLVKVGRDQWE